MEEIVTLLAGVAQPSPTPWVIFDPRAVAFLCDLSADLLRTPEARAQDVAAAFGFWRRPAHLQALARRHASPVPRLGRGLVFHVAPSNVPALFGYTMAIGLLADNANVVRASSHRGEADAVLLARLAQVLDRPEHGQVRERLSIVTYGRDNGVTAAYCARCDGRVVWGGDATVAALRAMPMPPHAVEFSFPDRWSLALFSQAAFSAMDGEELAVQARRFYNDTYQMDQNACSSPHLVLWLEDGGTPDCRARWWRTVAEQVVRRYDLGFYQAARKKETLCRLAMTMDTPPIASVEQYEGNRLYVACLDRLPADPTGLRGGFSLFFQSAVSGWEALLSLLSPKVQTLVCGGIEPEPLARYLAERGAGGVDRVVRLGQALEMDTIWDGKDLISGLSRSIEFG